MPTRDRRLFVARSVEMFLGQDHPALELVVVDDGADPIGDLLHGDPRLRYVPLAAARSIGVKRNIAAQYARGEIVVHWDDDDWHGPRRVSAQVAPILDGTADITGLGNPPFVDLRTGRFWACDVPRDYILFDGLVLGGTLAFRRSWWLLSGGYPDTSIGEDVVFLRAALARHARLAAIPDDHHYVCVRHPGNTWHFDGGDLGRLPGWRRIPAPAFLPETDRRFYATPAPDVPVVTGRVR